MTAAWTAYLAALDRLGQAGDVAALRALAADPRPPVRLLAQVGLARAGDRDGARLGARIAREPDLAVLAVLAARAGVVDPGPVGLANLTAQAALPATPPQLRAGCAWAVAAHDPRRGRALADRLLAAPDTAAWLAHVVARRGGPLAARIAPGAGRAALDHVADVVGLRPP